LVDWNVVPGSTNMLIQEHVLLGLHVHQTGWHTVKKKKKKILIVFQLNQNDFKFLARAISTFCSQECRCL